MSDPLSDIEDRKGQQDVGRVAYRVLVGAREEGASWRESLLVLTAWFLALWRLGVDEGGPES